MLNTEIAEVMQAPGKVYDVAEKVQYNLALNNEEKEIAEVMDAYTRNVGETGSDPDKQIAAFVTKTVSAKTINAMKQSPIVPCIFYDGAIERNIGGGNSGTRSTVAIQFDFTPLQRVKFYGRYFVDNGDYHERTQPWWIGDDQLSSDGSLASGSTKLYNLQYASTSHSDSYVSVDVSSITGKHYLCLQLPWDYGAVYIDYLKLIYNDA